MDRLYSESGNAAKITRETVAQEILQFASRLAEMADKTASHLQGKLHPVMLSDRPCETCEKTKEPREYPPFFDELRNRLHMIENSLYSIESAISRTEL